MTRAPIVAALALLAATAAFAGEPAAAPDYSKKALLRIVREMPQRQERPISFAELGVISIRTPFARAKVAYAPLPPLQGSVPRVTMEWPDPFIHTQSGFAMTPQVWARH
jgi:hypothetical protein